MLSTLLTRKYLFSSLPHLQNAIHFRKDSYNAIHITPK